MLMLHTLKKTGEPALLRALVNYTFQGDLPADFWQYYQAFRHVLKEYEIKPLYLDKIQVLARKAIGKRHQEYLTLLFSKALPQGLLGQLEGVIKNLDASNPQSLVKVDDLRTISVQLNASLNKIGNTNQNWIDRGDLLQDPRITELYQGIGASRLFGPQVSTFLMEQTQKGVQAFQTFCVEMGQKMALKDLKTNQPGAGVSPSQSLWALNDALSQLFTQDFMQQAPVLALPQTIPSGKFVSFDPVIIEQAFVLSQHYNTFDTKILPTLPVMFHGKLKPIAQQSLIHYLKYLMTKSLTLVDLPSQYMPQHEYAFLTQEAKHLDTSSGQLVTLIGYFDAKTRSEFLSTWLTHLSASYVWMLKESDRLLHALNPFAVVDFNFGFWDGATSAAFQGYNVADSTELKSYVDKQIQELSKLALEIAKPIVTFLSAPGILSGNDVKNPLFERWNRLVLDLDKYQEGKPDNNVKALVDFIVKPLAQDNAKEALRNIEIKPLHIKSAGFFQETLRALKTGMRSRAEILIRKQSLKSVEDLFAFYNEHLSGKFPFVQNIANTKGDADPERVRQFFVLYDQYGENAKDILDQIYQLGGKANALTQFFINLDQVKALFQNFVSNQSSLDIPTFDFTVNFRQNRSREANADLIADWAFQPNLTTLIRRVDNSQTGQWRYGNPVFFHFRLAQGKHITINPVQDQNQPHLHINGQESSFVFDGAWGLLKAIHMQRAPQSDYDPSLQDGSVLLKFTVPLNQNGTLTVYNSLVITQKPLDPKTKPIRLTIPVFPEVVPAIDPNIKGLCDHAVLTSAKVASIDFLSIKK